MGTAIDRVFIDKLAIVLEKSLSNSSRSLGIVVTRKNPSEHENFTDVVICAIGITGFLNGNLTIIIPQKTACQFVGKMLGSSYDQVNDDILDGCREVTNMIAGVIKMEMSLQGCDLCIGLPTSMIGHGLHMRFNPADKYLHQQYSSSDGDLEMYLAFKESESVTDKNLGIKSTVTSKDAAASLLEKMKKISQNPK